jgi:hypothetical protein
MVYFENPPHGRSTTVILSAATLRTTGVSPCVSTYASAAATESPHLKHGTTTDGSVKLKEGQFSGALLGYFRLSRICAQTSRRLLLHSQSCLELPERDRRLPSSGADKPPECWVGLEDDSLPILTLDPDEYGCGLSAPRDDDTVILSRAEVRRSMARSGCAN